MERFKSVPGFKRDIMAGSEGNILSIVTDDYLKPYIQNDQKMVEVCNRNGRVTHESVAELVAKAHLENPNPKLFCNLNFKDGNSLNCRANNLEWRSSKIEADTIIDKEDIDMKKNNKVRKNKGQSTNYTATFSNTKGVITNCLHYHGVDSLLPDTPYKSVSSINDRIRDQKPIKGFCKLEGYRLQRDDRKTEAFDNPKAPFRVNPHPAESEVLSV